MEKDYELERLSKMMDDAQRSIEYAKLHLDVLSPKKESLKSQIESCKYRIQDLKNCINNERDMARYCSQCGDRIDAQSHRYNADSYRDSLQNEYNIKDSLYLDYNTVKDEFDRYLTELRSAKEEKQKARDEFNSRLEYLKSKWHETSCRVCGGTIRYNEDWAHIPSVCKSCKTHKI